MAKEWEKQTSIYPLSPGHKFQPDDEQLLSTFLMGKVRGFPFIKPGLDNLIPTVDFKTINPEELNIGLGEEDNEEWYCFTSTEARSTDGVWSNSYGIWIPAGREEIIFNGEDRGIGFKKLFHYFEGNENHLVVCLNWEMEEYRISDDDSTGKMDNKWVLCKIYKEDQFFLDRLIRSIPNNAIKHLSQLVSSYQSLSLEDTGLGPHIVKSIIRISRKCKLDKVLDLPKVSDEISTQEQDLVVGKVYSKIMEIESRLIPCGCGFHVTADHQPPRTTKAIATLINIASLSEVELGVFPLSKILASTLGREIEDVYRGCGKGVAPDMELLRHITEASRCAVTTFVERNINKRWGIDDIDNSVAEIIGFDIDEPHSQHDFGRDDLLKFMRLFCELAERICRCGLQL